MLKGFLNSIILVPVLLAVLAGSRRRVRNHLTLLMALLVAYNLLFMLSLYVMHRKWLG